MASVLQQEMFRTLNNALSPLGIRVTDLGDGQWSISDGHSLTRFHDGVVSASQLSQSIMMEGWGRQQHGTSVSGLCQMLNAVLPITTGL